MVRYAFGRALMALAIFPSLAEGPADPVAPFIAHVAKHWSGRAAWSIDFKAFHGDRSALPIGVFDSGIGGLTVMEAILQLDSFNNETLRPGADGKPDFAGERFVYLGDQANMPYGNYPSAGKAEYLRELALKDAVFLLGTRWRAAVDSPVRNDKPPVKAIVIACNTATAYALEDIRAAVNRWGLNVPVIGVVEAGARDVAAALADEGKPHGVAVMATVGTCESRAYPRAIARATGQAGKTAPIVVQQGSVGLAGAIEGNHAFVSENAGRLTPYKGPVVDPALMPVYQFSADGLIHGRELNSTLNYVRYEVATLLENHRSAGGAPIDTVVLGCTHFPLVRKEFAEAFERVRSYEGSDGKRPYSSVVAERLTFIDPANSTARELFFEMAKAKLRNRAGVVSAPTVEFFVSAPNPQAAGVKLAGDGSLDSGYKTSRGIGQFEVEDTVVIPLTLKTLPMSSAKLIDALPTVAAALKER